MALSLSTGNIEVISRLDDSLLLDEVLSDDENLEDGKKDAYAEYLEDLDESRLTFVEGKEPTRFVMRKVLDYKKGVRIKNEQVKMNGKNDVQVQLGSMVGETVRAALIDIKHPEGSNPGALVFKRGSDGGASEELVALLDANGIAADLYAAHQNASKHKDHKKKSALSLS